MINFSHGEIIHISPWFYNLHDMEKIIRQELPIEQRKELDRLALQARMYLERWYKQEGKRHSKTIIKFVGGRCRPTEFETHFRKGGVK